MSADAGTRSGHEDALKRGSEALPSPPKQNVRGMSSVSIGVSPSSYSSPGGQWRRGLFRRFGRSSAPPGMREHVVRIPPNGERMELDAPLGLTARAFLSLVVKTFGLPENVRYVLIAKHTGVVVPDSAIIDTIDTKWHVRRASTDDASPSAPQAGMDVDERVDDTASVVSSAATTTHSAHDTSTHSHAPPHDLAVHGAPPLHLTPPPAIVSDHSASSDGLVKSRVSLVPEPLPLPPPPPPPASAVAPRGMSAAIGRRTIEKELIFIELSSNVRQAVAFVADDRHVLRAILCIAQQSTLPQQPPDSAPLSATIGGSFFNNHHHPVSPHVPTVLPPAAVMAAATDFNNCTASDFADVPRQFRMWAPTSSVRLYDAVGPDNSHVFKMTGLNRPPGMFRALSWADKRDWFNRIQYFTRISGAAAAAAGAGAGISGNHGDAVDVHQDAQPPASSPTLPPRAKEDDSDDLSKPSGSSSYMRLGRSARGGAAAAHERSIAAHRASVATLKGEIGVKVATIAELSGAMKTTEVNTQHMVSVLGEELERLQRHQQTLQGVRDKSDQLMGRLTQVRAQLEASQGEIIRQEERMVALQEGVMTARRVHRAVRMAVVIGRGLILLTAVAVLSLYLWRWILRRVWGAIAGVDEAVIVVH